MPEFRPGFLGARGVALPPGDVQGARRGAGSVVQIVAFGLGLMMLQLLAVVRVATELTAAQRRRLADVLTNAYGQGIHLNVVHDPAVVGGMSVQIGDELVDGTAASRLAAVRRRLAS